MHNWRLLLLACLAAFQPIASFTERSLVDGRLECSQHHGLRDTRPSIYGTYRLTKPTEEQRLSHQKTREADDYRHEVRDNSVLVTTERRVAEAREESRPERSAKFARVQNRVGDSRFARSVDDWPSSLRVANRRSRDVSRERLVRESRDTRQNDRRQREASFDGVVERRATREDTRRSQLPIDARRDSRRNGDFLRDARRSESRLDLHRSRVEVARMEPARQRKETRIPMERARQMDWAIGSRRDARLQHRERAMGGPARDEAGRRSSSLNSRNINMSPATDESSTSRVDIGKVVSHDRFAVDRRDVRNVRDERDLARREVRGRTERRSREEERRNTGRSEFRSRDLSRSRNSEARISELQRSREKRTTDRTPDVRRSTVTDLERRSSGLERSSDSERRTVERSSEFRSGDMARFRSLEARGRELDGRSTERPSNLRRSRNVERRSIESSSNLRRAREFTRSRSIENRISYTDKRSSERSSELRRETVLNRRFTDRSTELRRVGNFARSGLETSSMIEKATSERPESRRILSRQVLGSHRVRRGSFNQASRAQTSDERRTDLSRYYSSNERESRQIVEFRSERWETRRDERDSRIRNREASRTIFDTRRVETRKMNGRETRDQVMDQRDFRNTELNRRSDEARNTRLNVEARYLKDLALERDAFASQNRAREITRSNSNARQFNHETSQMEAQSFPMNWHYLLYTVQAIYLASFLVKMLGENGPSEKKIRSHGIWSPAQKLLKLE